MVYIFCVSSSEVHGERMHMVSSGKTLGKALDVLRQHHRAGVAVHHLHFGRPLFYTNGWLDSYKQLISA